MSKSVNNQEKQSDLTQEMEVIKTKILHLLKIYPVISPTMLQSALGPSTKPTKWRPCLKRLIDSGEVIEEQESMQTPTERYNTYSKLSLPGTKVSVGQ